MLKILWILTNLCRLLLAVTFIFSAIVKMIDPQGVQYKVLDYVTALGLDIYVDSLWALVIGIGLSLLEFMLGIYTFFGIRRRNTSVIMLLFLLFMTCFTLYLALYNPVTDCGCFGDAVKLSNWQTFGKNLVLLLMVLFVLTNLARMTRFISERNQWIISLYSLVFGFCFVMYNLYYLPVVDFRPYHIGADVYSGVMEERYGNASTNEYLDFSIHQPQGEEITESWLKKGGYKFMLVAPTLSQADDSNCDRLNNLYDYCLTHGYPFVCLTSSVEQEIAKWRDGTGAEYPIAFTDGTVLRTMIRSNPGLLLFYGGRIVMKYAHTEFPQVDEQTPRIEQMLGKTLVERNYFREAISLLLMFLVPLFIVSFADRLWVGSKYYQRYRIRHINQIKTKTQNEKKNCCR